MAAAQTPTPLVIREPLTIGDDGKPTLSDRYEDIRKDLTRVLDLIEDERHLCAIDLLDSVSARLALAKKASSQRKTEGAKQKRVAPFLRQSKTKSRPQDDKELQAIELLMQENKELLRNLKNRVQMFRAAKADLTLPADWVLAQTFLGITTYYRREEDGSLSIKMEGGLGGVPLFDQVAVIREVDLHYKWAPFCSSSLTIAHLQKLDTVGWFIVGLPAFGLASDGCFRAIGCDCTAEDGSIILVGEGIADRPASAEDQTGAYNLRQDDVIRKLDLPPEPRGLGRGRMTIHKFQGIIHVESPTSVSTKIIANIDPHLDFLPQRLIDFLMKRLLGVLLSKMQNAAKRVSKDPVTNPHAMRMRQDDFYKKWLIAKFQGVCAMHGWDMPAVAAFELSDEQLQEAAKAEERALAKSRKRLSHVRSNDSVVFDQNLNHTLSTISEPPYVGQPSEATGRSFRSRSKSYDTDTVSELSTSSSSTLGSLWTKNPISKYLREMEEKTQLRKAREIEASREKAAARLRPKALHPMESARLDELRSMKKKPSSLRYSSSRVVVDGVDSAGSSSPITEGGHAPAVPISWGATFTTHGLVTQVAVVAALFSLLLGTLNSDVFFSKFSLALENERTDGMFLLLVKDTVVLVNLATAASLHFLLCYASLMYSFGGLRLARMAGDSATKFFSENVHLFAGGGSLLMLILGLGKALFGLAVRQCLFLSLSLLHILEQQRNSVAASAVMLSVPDMLVPSVEKLLSLSKQIIGVIGALLWKVASGPLGLFIRFLKISHDIFLKSNSFGRTLLWSVGSVPPALSKALGRWNRLLVEVEDDVSAGASSFVWRKEAYMACRGNLLYSSVFLLSILVMFRIQARSTGIHSKAKSTSSSTNGS